jgi:hypothetical protein
MPLILNGATSGSTTIQATDAVTQTITLPNATGTVLTTNGSGIASVNGIQFPATQSASANANTLDDYEEGTWTPNLTARIGTITGQTCTGTYVKTGKQVTVTYLAQITAGTVTSIRGISNLPFTTENTTQTSIGYCQDLVTAIGWQFLTDQNATTAIFSRVVDNTANGVNNTYGWKGTLVYFTD